MTIRSLALAGLLAALFAPAARPGPDEKPKDKARERPAVHKTPQECFDAYVATEAKDDHKRNVDCLAPEVQDNTAVYFAQEWSGIRARFGKVEDRVTAALCRVLDRHGATEQAMKGLGFSKDPRQQEKASKAILKLIKDRAAFLTDFHVALDEVNPKPRLAVDFVVKKTLTDVKIDGDRATATAVTTRVRGKDKSVSRAQVFFVRVNGGWRLYPPGIKPVGASKDGGRAKD